VPLTNLIRDEGINYYQTAYSVYAFALNLSSVFMIATVSRSVSERIALKQYRNAHTLFKSAMAFSVCLGVVGTAVMYFGAGAIVSLFNFQPHTVYSIRAVSPAVFVVSMLTVFRGYFMGMKTSAPTAVSQVIEQVFNVVFSLWLAFLFYDAGVQYSAAGAAGGTAISAVAALGVVAFVYFMVAKALKKRADEDKSPYRERFGTQIWAIVKTAVPIVIGLSIFSIAGLMDISMANSRIYASGAFSQYEINDLIGMFLGKFILLTTLPVSLSMALSSAVIPEITSAHVTMDIDAVRENTNRALRLSMMLSIPAAVGLGVLADPIIGLIFPRAPEGGWLLRYGAVSIVFVAVVHIITGVLQGVGHVRLPVIGVAVGVAVKFPVNYFLMAVPEINILGAVISTIVCFAVAAVINIILLYRYTGIFPDLKGAFLKPSVASVGMGFVCFSAYGVFSVAASSAVAALAAIAIGMVFYVILMILIRGFGESDLDALPIPARVRRWLHW
jgi:stage V sporulation protein B